MKFYAVKMVDNKSINNIYTEWEKCKKIVSGHHAIYRSFKKKEDAINYLEKDICNDGTENEELSLPSIELDVKMKIIVENGRVKIKSINGVNLIKKNIFLK